MDVKYRPLYRFGDFHQVLKLQKQAWGMQDIDVLPTHLLIAYKKTGELWGAFAQDELAGFAVALPTPNPSIFYLHMIATKTKWRGKGIGDGLLRRMFSRLRRRGYAAVYWSYDILDFVNINFYQDCLKGIGVGMAYNLYGLIDSRKQRKLPSHRVYCLKILKPVNSRCFSDKKVGLHIPLSLSELQCYTSADAVQRMDVTYKKISGIFSSGYVMTRFNNKARNLVFSKIRNAGLNKIVRSVRVMIYDNGKTPA